MRRYAYFVAALVVLYVLAGAWCLAFDFTWWQAMVMGGSVPILARWAVDGRRPTSTPTEKGPRP